MLPKKETKNRKYPNNISRFLKTFKKEQKRQNKGIEYWKEKALKWKCT